MNQRTAAVDAYLDALDAGSADPRLGLPDVIFETVLRHVYSNDGEMPYWRATIDDLRIASMPIHTHYALRQAAPAQHGLTTATMEAYG